LERPFFSQSKNPEQKRGFEKLIFPKIVHDAQKIQAKVFSGKIGPFLRDCLIFANSRDFIEKNVANFVDSHVRVGVYSSSLASALKA
jgi:hypothetical protein